MSKLFASWVPGYAVVAETMGPPTLELLEGRRFSDVNGFRFGQGAQFKISAKQGNWFHIPLPTPVLVEDRRAGLNRVMVLFTIDGGALQHVKVHDGLNEILDRPGLDIAGNHQVNLDDGNTFDVNHDAIAFGVGISLFFRAGDATATLFIGSAGGDFFHNI
jgi:hypothetical protein